MFKTKTKEYRYVLKLDKYEYGIILNDINRYYLKLKRQNQNTAYICELTLRIVKRLRP